MVACLNLHPFYVSLIRLDDRPDVGTVQATLKIFTDDLEACVGKHQPGATLSDTAAVRSYITNRVGVLCNTEKSAWQWVGYETEFDVTWIYLECSRCADGEKITVEASYLNEEFSEQSHVVHFNRANRVDTDLLHRDKTRCNF